MNFTEILVIVGGLAAGWLVVTTAHVGLIKRHAR